MKYAYPAIFSYEEGKILASVPDLHAHTFGDSIEEAVKMAKDAMETLLWDSEEKSSPVPAPSALEEMSKGLPQGQFAAIVAADTDAYRKSMETRAVKKTLSIPAWLNWKAEEANAPFSKILQEALKQYLGIEGRQPL
jgi:predicted RNase H-like HicB family nuclease